MIFSDTDLDSILGCSPLTKGKKDCIDIATSYPLSIGFHALGGYRNLNPGGFNAMDFVQDRVFEFKATLRFLVRLGGRNKNDHINVPGARTVHYFFQLVSGNP